MSEGRTPPTIFSAIAAALSQPALVLGAGTAVVLFLSMSFLPVVGMFFGLFTPLPLFLFYFRRGRIFGLTMIGLATLAVMLILSLSGRISGIIFFFECCVLAVILAEGFRRPLPPEKLVGLSAGALLLVGLFFLSLVGLAQGQPPWTYGKKIVEEQVHLSLRMYQSIFEEPIESPGETRDVEKDVRRYDPDRSTTGEAEPSGRETAADDQWVKVLIGIFPGLMVLGSLLIAWANFMSGRAFLAKIGRLPQELADLKTWSAPEGLVWAAIAGGFALFIPLNWVQLLAVNVLMVLGLIYFFQGLSVLAYWLNKKGAPTFFKVFCYALIALQQYLTLVVAAMGLFDIWFNFRKIDKKGLGRQA